ncbi:unnamed protein product [Protopolystoma xenopodis]|uniref:Uncharacterized protein n=1 Tax=Protopolystoma xenopodis TaxID=117903 RepID=A0A3S5FCL6_9PLAT|nr:unnamed protein product [Protopolystoma xenopodis]
MPVVRLIVKTANENGANAAADSQLAPTTAVFPAQLPVKPCGPRYDLISAALAALRATSCFKSQLRMKPYVGQQRIGLSMHACLR